MGKERLVIRSFPEFVPPNRAYVVDDIPIYKMINYDYSALPTIFPQDLILLEWDMAVDADELEQFKYATLKEPDRPLVAPYKISGTKRHWVHWHGDGVNVMDWVNEGDPYCDGAGFGMIYLPYHLTMAYLRDNPTKHLTDTNFSIWYNKPIPIAWGIRPVHLH